MKFTQYHCLPGLILALTLPARAEELPVIDLSVDASTADDRVERARQLYREASELGRLGDWQAALTGYEQSAKLVGSASTLYNIGFCSMKLGDIVSAWYWMNKSVQVVPDATDPASALSPERATEAKKQLAALYGQLAQVQLDLHQATQIEVDGKPLAPVPNNTDEGRGDVLVAHESGGHREGGWVGAITVLVTAGSHRVRFVAVPTGAAETLDIETKLGAPLAITWPFETRRNQGTHPPVSSPPSLNTHRLSAAPEKTSSPANPSRWAQLYPAVQWGSVGVLAAGGIAATVSLAIYLTADQKLDGECDEDGICPDDLENVVDRHHAAGVMTNVGIWTAIAGGVVAATAFGFRPKSSRSGLAIEVNARGISARGRF